MIIIFAHVSVRPYFQNIANKRRINLMIATGGVWQRGSLMTHVLSLNVTGKHFPGMPGARTGPVPVMRMFGTNKKVSFNVQSVIKFALLWTKICYALGKFHLLSCARLPPLLFRPCALQVHQGWPSRVQDMPEQCHYGGPQIQQRGDQRSSFGCGTNE